MRPISRETLAWVCRELAPNGRLVRVRPMRGGVSCSVHEVWLESAAGARRRVVVRRYGEGWSAEDADLFGREFKLLHALFQAGVAVPEPLLLDDAASTLVMTRLPGRGTLQPRNLQGYLGQLAQVLAQIHQLPTAALQFVPSERTRDEPHLARGPQTDEPLQSAVWDAVQRMWPSIPVGASLVHGDYWPGNTVWYGQRLSGVVDWEMAVLGNPMRDVATCRCDLANLFDVAAADEFTRLYECASGEAVRDLPYWDLRVCTSALRYMDDWSRGYRDLGRKELTSEEATRRVAVFARSALAHAQE